MDFEIEIDGRKAGVNKGETILQAAARIGIEIPVFCWHPKIDPVGACRMCLVEVEKMPKLVVACATPAVPNMVVHTANERVANARSGVLEFLLVDHPLDCPTCDKGGECTLQDNVYHHGLDRSRFTETKHRFERDPDFFLDDAVIGPQMIRNMNRCIRCYRCTRFTQEVAGEGDLGIFNRGWHTEIDTLPDREIGNLYSGNTVEICPVGALMSEDFRYTARPWVSYRTPSVCNLCPDGCNLTYWSNRRELFRATSRRNDGVDEGWICDRGRYTYAYRQSPRRILTPQRGDRKCWTPVAWPEAISDAALALERVLKTHGAGAVGGMVSPLSSNESIYLFQRFFRSVLGSNSVDWRLDRKQLVRPERRRRKRAFPRASRPIALLERTELIVALGCDLENERSITSLRALKAQRKAGAKVFLVNNRPTRLRRKADREWIYALGSELELWRGLVKLLVEAGVPGEVPPALKTALDEVSLGHVAQSTGLPEHELRALAQAIAKARSCVIYMGRDIRQSPDQEQVVDLALSAGELLGLDGGERGAVELSSEFANAIGATLMGGEPEVLPGGIDAHDTKHASRLAELWGAAMPLAGGYDAGEMLEAAHNDRLKALVLFDINPLFHFPDSDWVRRALAKLDCIICLGQFDVGHPGFADYFLPTSTVQEDSGTFISGEGRLQYFEAAVRRAGETRPAREVLSALAAELGKPWRFESAQDVFREMATAIPVLGQTSHPALRDTEGVLLPLDPHRQDRESLFASATEALSGPPVELPRPTPERFVLLTGNAGHHFAHLSQYSEPVMNFASVPYALLHPEDARTLEVENGDWILMRSSRGQIELTARPSPLIVRGAVFVPVHHSSANPNELRDRGSRTDWVHIEKIADRRREDLRPKVAIAEVGAWTL
jgi:NADH-quinone oxidoreductase chain G